MTTPAIRRAAELIHDAMDAADAGYHERESGVVDTTSDELAAALLRAGWTPPGYLAPRVRIPREPGMAVHHLDGNLWNNDPANLAVVPIEQHARTEEPR